MPYGNRKDEAEVCDAQVINNAVSCGAIKYWYHTLIARDRENVPNLRRSSDPQSVLQVTIEYSS